MDGAFDLGDGAIVAPEPHQQRQQRSTSRLRPPGWARQLAAPHSVVAPAATVPSPPPSSSSLGGQLVKSAARRGAASAVAPLTPIAAPAAPPSPDAYVAVRDVTRAVEDAKTAEARGLVQRLRR
jgi:hypothetical protein